MSQRWVLDWSLSLLTMSYDGVAKENCSHKILDPDDESVEMPARSSFVDMDIKESVTIPEKDKKSSC